MRLRLAGSIAIQGLGAASTFAIGVLIAMLQGPEAQGRYGLVRSAADLLLALALFGLPQSLVHLMNQRAASPAGLERLSLRYAGALLVMAVLACAAVALVPGMRAWVDSPLGLFALLLGTVGWVLQGLQRVFVLCRGSALQFSWLSVTPSLSLFSAVAVLLLLGSQHYEWALAASGLVSAALGARQLSPLRAQAGWREGGAAPMGELLGAGAHAFAQSVALALQPWLTLLLLRQQGASTADIGHFVFAAYVYQAFALPASFVSPLLFARISQAAGAGRPYEIRAAVLQALAATAVASLLCAVLLPWLVPRVFGAAYAPTVTACVWMALAGPLVVLNRLGVSVLLGWGRFRAASLHALWRALLIPACLLPCLAAGWGSAVSAAAASWLLVEALCGAAVLVMWKQGQAPGTSPLPRPAKDEA